MWNEPTNEELEALPKLYETEHINIRDKPIVMHFFLGSCDWYVCEFDGHDIFFGFVILNNNMTNAEWGYISLSELKKIKVHGCYEVDRDLYWEIRPAIQVDKIREGHGWEKDNETLEIKKV